jgi:hypothetical protein
LIRRSARVESEVLRLIPGQFTATVAKSFLGSPSIWCHRDLDDPAGIPGKSLGTILLLAYNVLMTFGDFDAMARVLVSSAILWAGGIALSHADSPPRPPYDHEVKSPSGNCVARAEANASRIVGSRLAGRLAGRQTETLWTFPAYRHVYAVADDCQTLIVIYDGANLLGLNDRDPSTVIITFYESAREVRKVTLGEIYPDLAVLERTVSHWAWYRSTGWMGKDWMVETVDGRTLTFNARSQR